MTHVEGPNEGRLAQDLDATDVDAVDGSLRSDAFRRSVVFTACANLVALYLLAVSSCELSVAVGAGLAAGQTGILAARLGLFGGLLSRRLATAAVGLMLHAAAIAILSAILEGSTADMRFVFATSLAGLGLAMAGVASLAWLLGLQGRTRLLTPHSVAGTRLRFSILHLVVVTTIVAVLTVICRWAASFERNAFTISGLFAVHEILVFWAALVYFGTFDDRFRAGFWTVMAGVFAWVVVGAVEDRSRGFVFVFELVHAAMILVWLSAWRVIGGNQAQVGKSR